MNQQPDQLAPLSVRDDCHDRQPEGETLVVPRIANAFSVDVEDYFQVTAFERDIPRSQWASFPSRVVQNTRRLLELLARHQVHGTFFVLGWTAERFPQLIHDIHAAGHEIGSHSYWHRLIYEQTPDEFRDDLRRSREVLTDIIGQKVNCFRAPTFSITRKSWWALEILVEEGFTVDSSIFPVRHDRYGVPDAEPGIHEITTPSGSITEFPPSTLRRLGRNLPVAGGGYFRLYPFALSAACLRRINRHNRAPFMFYVHPWEIDPRQPRLRVSSFSSRARHYVGLARTHSRLDDLLGAFPFGTMQQAIEYATKAAGQESH